MKKSLQHSMKAVILAVSTLFAANTMADNVIGQPVTEFTDPATMQLDYPYTLQGSTRTLLRTKLLTFKIEVPADGLYGVEYLVNVTGNNVQLGATASTEADVYSAPDWTDFAHVTSKTDDDLVTPKNPEDEIIEDEEAPVDSTEAVEIGTPIYLYSAVNLAAGVNYVHVWMHVYWRNDNIAPQKVQFKSVRLMGQGSGEVAALAARASQKAYRVKFFTSLQDATTATMVSDYEALVSAIGNDYTNASTAAIEADIAAMENDLGFVVDQFVPGLTVDYEVVDQSSGNVAAKGTFMQMNASDGPHYGANINLNQAGTYTARFIIHSPAENNYFIHTDEDTKPGADLQKYWPNDKPLTVEFKDWVFDGKKVQPEYN